MVTNWHGCGHFKSLGLSSLASLWECSKLAQISSVVMGLSLVGCVKLAACLDQKFWQVIW